MQRNYKIYEAPHVFFRPGNGGSKAARETCKTVFKDHTFASLTRLACRIADQVLQNPTEDEKYLYTIGLVAAITGGLIPPYKAGEAIRRARQKIPAKKVVESNSPVTPLHLLAQSATANKK